MDDFEKWFKTTEAYKLLEDQNYFKMDLFFFVAARNQYRHSGVQIAYLTWQLKQTEIDQLKEALEIKEQLNEALRVADKDKDKRIGELEHWNKNQYDLLKQQDLQLENLNSLAMELEDIAKTLSVTEGRGAYYDSACRIKQALRGEHE